uniref:Adenosylmethionine-8-amino-7-oxononanoate aminotransferase n=1 Tax=Haptolina ericina TaxID=156174 RepID=A0A7S3F2E6_9EUKA
MAPLATSAAVHDVRVLGAIGVVEMVEPVHLPSVQALLVERGVWLRPFGRMLYTMPPFVISSAELRRVTDGMRAVVEATERGLLGSGAPLDSERWRAADSGASEASHSVTIGRVAEERNAPS